MIHRHVRRSDFAPATRVMHRETRMTAGVLRELKNGIEIVVKTREGRLERWAKTDSLRLPAIVAASVREIELAIGCGLTINQVRRCV